MLEAVGLNEFEEHVYRLLLSAPRRPLAELAAEAGAGTGRVRRALARLRDLGLLTPAERGQYLPVAPDVALSALVQRRHMELNETAGALHEFTGRFRAGQLTTDPAGLIEVLTDAQAIAQRSLAEYVNAQTETLSFDTPPYAWPPGSLDEVATERPLLDRGVHRRVVYTEEALRHPGRMETVLALVALGEQARTTPDVPVKLLIHDRRVALMPLTTTDRAHDSMVVIHRSGPLTALVALFEAVWSTATPVAQSARAGELPPEEAEVLTLLAAGFKDDAIARHLAVSSRTARRRIAAVLEHLHGSTRFQAGANAVRRGLL